MAAMEYKCPNCNGTLTFESTLQKMKCSYCDTEIDVEAMNAYEEEVKNDRSDETTWETTAGGKWQEGETEGMLVYNCQSCGANVVGDETMGATTCPYCGNNIVLLGQFQGDLRPDYVIPFKLDKKAAKEAYKRHLQGKKLLPEVFKDENHVEEIKGVYVPFWLFDTKTNAHMRYKGTKTHVWSDSNYRYTRTSFYNIVRGGTIDFQKVPVDGSTKMPDDLMESLEPFDFSQAVDFQTAYLAGYLADKYDVDEKESVNRANERIKKSTEEMFRRTVTGYGMVVSEHSTVQYKEGKASYALYPVWILTTKWQGQSYIFAMNGQTGKFVGDLPVDKSLAWKYHWKYSAIIAAVVFIISLIGILL